MKYVALVLLGLAPATFACQPMQVGNEARELARTAKQLENAASNAPGYASVAYAADRLQEDARRLARLVQNGSTCHELGREFRLFVEPSFVELRRTHRVTQQGNPNGFVKQRFQEVGRNHRQLHDAIQTPIVDPCGGLAGGYAGICRVDNSSAASAITFTVGVQGNSCVAYNSPYFQPAALAVGGGAGSANVVQHPGGVAITQTTLMVYGQGRFVMRGYNYAGKFWFSCTP